MSPELASVDPLVARLSRGERAAFDEVYDAHRARLFAFCVRLTSDRARAEDIVQDTFVRLARSAAGLHPDVKLRAWLFRVARNLHVDARRRALLDLDRLRELALWPTARRVERTPLDAVQGTETQRRLEAAIAALAPPYREAILLVGVEGFTPRDAAEIVGIADAAMRQRLARARKMLKAAMETDR